ncbi:ATP-dependent nuclease [Helicobacter cholecystus]|uniref:ATP-dependent nuclease n=1 Tax=Helicobacter cholecystus TaxID=45498 RepID=UPI00273A5728|nr:ATP-binding protein [Helicobacter cholecystus]
MELTKIEISNFRSIQWMEINIEKINNKRCLILLGKNEAGKSNILKAISAVFGRYNVSEKDQRKEKSGENIRDEDYFICAVFELSQEDFSEIYNIFLEKYKNIELISFKNGISIEDFIAEVFSSVLIRIDIFSDKKPWMGYWAYKKEIHFNQNIVLQGDEFLENDNNENQSFTINNLIKILFEIIREKWDLLSLYQCEKWEYKESFLLPNKVEIEAFKNNPDEYIPLKKLFFLGGKTNISKAIDDAYKRDEGLVNLLDNISKEATKAFKKTWKDLGDVSFSLTKDGDFIFIHIQDELKFPMEDRSEGFKHFVSMLLAFSPDDEGDDCKKILLIDEPDTHLYPTSIKNLRDELLKIAQKHLVIYSTHSPYMIDDMAIGQDTRHLIIEKKGGITSTCIPDRKPNYAKDELLLRAIGCSVFERVKNKNIIFEGYNDFCLFMKFKKDSIFKDYGAIYLAGISDIAKIAPMIMLTGTKFCVVADSDDTSKSYKKNFEKDFPNYADCWLEYDEYKQQHKTLEDFFRQDYVKEVMLKEYSDVVFDTQKSTIENIKHIVEMSCDSKEQKKEKIRLIKNQLVDKAEAKDLQGYMDFLKKLEKKMELL